MIWGVLKSWGLFDYLMGEKRFNWCHLAHVCWLEFLHFNCQLRIQDPSRCWTKAYTFFRRMPMSLLWELFSDFICLLLIFSLHFLNQVLRQHWICGWNTILQWKMPWSAKTENEMVIISCDLRSIRFYVTSLTKMNSHYNYVLLYMLINAYKGVLKMSVNILNYE